MALQQTGVQLVAQGAAPFLADVTKGSAGVAAFGQAATHAVTGVNAFTASVDHAAKIQGLTDKLAGQKKELGILEQELTKTAEKYKEGSTQAQRKELAIQKLTAAIGVTERSLVSETHALNAEAHATQEAGQAAATAAVPVKQLGKEAQEAGGGISALQQIAIGAFRQIGALAVNALGQAAKAIGSFVADSVNVAGDFEAGMNKFQAVAGKGVDTKGLEEFKDLFISLGRELPVSTSEVEQAAIEMVSGGIDPAIIKGGALRQTLEFAAASGLSLADAAATSAKFLAGWTSSSATAAEKIAFLASSTDDLTKAAAASSTTVAELRLGIFNVQGAAQALHAPFSDVVASLALLAPAFESSAQAGTALNVFMTRLVPATNPATDAMKELSIISTDYKSIADDLGVTLDGSQQSYAALNDAINATITAQVGAGASQKEFKSAYDAFIGDFQVNAFFDAQGAFLGMSNAAQVLKDHLGTLTDEQKISTLHTLFGNDAQKVANLLMQDGAAGLEAIKQKMDEANGVSQTAALMQQGYNVALENAKGSVEALQITIGSFLLPVLSDLLNNVIAPGINQLTTFAGALSGNDDAFNQLWPPMQQIAIFLQPIIDGFGANGLAGALAATITQIDTLIPGFANIVTWLSGALSTAIAFVTDHWDTLSGVLGAVGAAFGTLVVISSVVGWVGGLIATVGTLAATFTAASGGIAGVAAILGGPVTLAIGAVALAVGGLVLAWNSDFMGIQTTLTAFWTTTAQPILAQLVTWLSANVPTAIATLSSFWTNTLQPALAAVWSFLQDNIFPILEVLANTYLALAGAEVGALAALWTGTLWPALQNIAGFLSGTIFPILGALANVYIALTKKEVEALSGLWQKTLLPALQSVGAFITGTVEPALKSAGDTINTVVGPAVQAFTGWLSGATGGLNGIAGAVQGAIRWLNDLASRLNNLELPDWMTPGSPTPWEIGLRGVSAAMAQLTQGPMPRLTMQLQGVAATTSPLVPMAATAGQILGGVRGGATHTVVNVDARGSTLTAGQIERAVRAGIGIFDRGIGRDVDARLRTGA
jgi:TP901 family phage tail tape measure protein